MSERFCSLIVFGPGAPTTFKLHVSRGVLTILLLAFLLSLVFVALLGYRYPSPVDEFRRAELEAENRALRVEASNAAMGIKKLDAKLSELEARSKRINELATQ